MNLVYILAASLLQTIKIPILVCRMISLVFFMSFDILSVLFKYLRGYCLEQLAKYEPRENHAVVKNKPIDTKPAELLDKEMPVDDDRGIVGKTKTEFITELPKPKEISPLFSEDLEKEAIEEEPNTDALDIETKTIATKDMLKEDEPELFSHQGEAPSEMASGIPLEDMVKLGQTLSSDKASQEDEKQAFSLLTELEGTEMLGLILREINFRVRSKELMERYFEEIPEETPISTGFDLSMLVPD